MGPPVFFIDMLHKKSDRGVSLLGFVFLMFLAHKICMFILLEVTGRF